jgi:hypothetical protein
VECLKKKNYKNLSGKSNLNDCIGRKVAENGKNSNKEKSGPSAAFSKL